MQFRLSDFYKNVFKLASGSTLANVIPILISPLITRLFTEAEFGFFTVYTSIVVILGSFSTGKFELAILLPKSRSIANYTMLLAIGCSALFSILFLFVITLLFDPVSELLGLEASAATYVLYLVPLGVILTNLIQIFNYRLLRDKKFNVIATGNVAKTTSLSVSQLGIGYKGFTQTGLISGYIFGHMIGSVVYGVYALRGSGFFSQNYRKRLLKKVFYAYSKFPRYTAVHSFTNTTSSNLPSLILVTFFSESIAGLYGLGTRICFTPIRLISTSVNQVFSHTITEKFNRKDDIYKPTVKAVYQMALFGLVPFLILLLFSDIIFGFVFGESWTKAGTYAQILSPYLFLVFILTPITYIPILLNEQKKAFLIELGYLFFRIAALMIGGLYGNDILAIMLFSIVGFCFQLYSLYWYFKLCKNVSY